jgi:hypothetical protein
MLNTSRVAAGCVAGLAAVALLTITLRASSPTFWTVSTQADFLKGDVENLSIDNDGRVSLGPAATELTETAEPFIWTVLAGDNGTLWAGTGNQGQVLRVGRDGKTSVFFDAGEMEVHALAAAPHGGLYVATSPDGKIYEVSEDGKSRVFFDPDDKYIWALAVAPDGSVYAATGEKGVIYRITPDGAGAVFYKTNTTNVVTLAFDGSGNLLAGTESPGRVYRIDHSGKGFVVLDSPFKEMHAIRVAPDGSLYAAAFSGAPGGEDRSPLQIPQTSETPSQPSAPVPSVSTEVTAISVVDSISSIGSPIVTSTHVRNAKGAIYHIRPDGLWDTVWEATDDWPFDLLIDADGSLLVGTGTEGKLFKLSGDPARPTLLARVQARQITALTRDSAGRIVGAASNPGKLFALAETPAASGTYESDIRDAGTVATWGAIRWRGTSTPGELELSTRSGNTATPDDTWSAWSSPYTNADGDHVTSPNARYLQWKAVLKRSQTAQAPVPVLTSVTAAYLPRNLRPVVSSITVHPPGVVFQKPFSTGELEIAGFDDSSSADGKNPAQQQSQSATSGLTTPGTPALGRKVYQKGLQTLVWKADDENDDRLQYDVYYRREGETAWKLLKRGLWDPIFVWDTTSVPDGTYYAKVTASDAPSNSPETALVGEAESTSFDIDNTPPAIEVRNTSTANGKSTVAFAVRDAQSAIQRVEYSLDASRWQTAYPTDGIPDSRLENFQVSVDAGTAARSIIIRATDAMNNIATAVAEIRR